MAIGIGSMAYGQKTDIGLHLTSDTERTFLLEMRTQIADKWKFTGGLTYATEGRRQVSEQVIGSTDSTVTSLVYRESSKYGGLNLGFERQFKESIFSIRGNFGVIYQREVSDYEGQMRSTLNPGMVNYLPTPDSYIFAQRPQVTWKYVKPYLGLALHMNFPISDRFFINLFVGTHYNLTFLMEETDKFDPEEQYANNPQSGNFNFAIPAGVGLRYQFGK